MQSYLHTTMELDDSQKLNPELVKIMLQEAYEALPTLMTKLAPRGWERSTFHKELMDTRRLYYKDYLKSIKKSKKRPPAELPRKDDEDDFDPDQMSMEEYLYIIFPPFHNDKLELFYILSCLLLEITLVSNLYRADDPDFYHFDERKFEDTVFQIAYQNKEISKEWADVMVFSYPVPFLDEIELHYCLEVLFNILKKQGFQLIYWHDELLFIAQQQEKYAELLYAGLEDQDKEQKRERILGSIQLVLHAFDKGTIDPLNLSAIINLYNRYEICPIVLAYLHVYGEFPKGYPYRLEHYGE